jgi:hypothetical protein
MPAAADHSDGGVFARHCALGRVARPGCFVVAISLWRQHCLLAGFYLLRVHNTAVATYAAAALNFDVAFIAYPLSAGQTWWKGAAGVFQVLCRMRSDDFALSSVLSDEGELYMYLNLTHTGFLFRWDLIHTFASSRK